MHQRICLSEVVEELIPQATPEMGPGDKAGDVEELDGDGAFPGAADAVVGGAEGLFIDASAGAVDLKVADCALGVNGGEAALESEGRARRGGRGANGKLPRWGVSEVWVREGEATHRPWSWRQLGN